MEELEVQQLELGEDEPLIGCFHYTVDDKWRVFVPIEWRRRLGTDFYLTVSPSDMLYIFAAKDWNNLSKKLMEKYNEDPQGMGDIMRRFLGNAHKVKADNNWRFIVPSNFRDTFKPRSAIYFVGRGDRAEMLTEDAYKQWRQETSREEVKRRQAALGF